MQQHLNAGCLQNKNSNFYTRCAAKKSRSLNLNCEMKKADMWKNLFLSCKGKANLNLGALYLRFRSVNEKLSYTLPDGTTHSNKSKKSFFINCFFTIAVLKYQKSNFNKFDMSGPTRKMHLYVYKIA